uniref:Otoferlin n=1 Tax=Cacopsylla melanoneura TaxID=428564 RepID=A0A8D8QAC2_9HEMI
MSLILKLKQFTIAKSKGEKIAKVEFRGVSQSTKPLEDKGDLLIVDQKFDWPIARPLEEQEEISVQLFFKGYLSCKPCGSCVVPLQSLVEEGRQIVHETLVDPTGQSLPARVQLELKYIPPDPGSTGSPWAMDDDHQMLVDIEQNIANLEKSLALDRTNTTTPPSPSRTQIRSKLLRNGVRTLMRFGKRRQRREDDLMGATTDTDGEGQSAPPGMIHGSSNSSLESDNESTVSQETTPRRSKRLYQTNETLNKQLHSALKSQDFQVCVTIIEARQLAGLNMDPVVCVQVGDVKKYTSVKESTNCPYYNEYFVFDFHMPAVMLFDKIITLSVVHSKKILRTSKHVGSFKLDVSTVFAQPDHQFYHKWALLTDPDDIAGGPKGYLKCDISVIGKGDTVKIPQKSEKDEDDIEANLLLPEGVPLERQHARFIIRIYRADGLPKMNSSLVANVKKAFTGESKDLVDPYVQVSFAGLTGKTSVKKNSYNPIWNEQIVFSEMFPPLCSRIKIQIRDNDPVNNTVIGTHYIDLKNISNDGDKGFLPTFGPNFVHMYGSTRDYSLLDENYSLNTGLGEGVSYRARLLIAIRTEITDNIDIVPSEVEVESTFPVVEHSYGKNEEFFLFGTILEATMIDKRLGEKPVFLEMSIGNAGNTLDGYNQPSQENAESETEEPQLEMVTSELVSWQSTTSPVKPMTHDRTYYFLPFWDDKPCVHVRSNWPDYRRRMYNSNILAKMSAKLEEGLQEVQSLIDCDLPETEKKLKSVLDELANDCNKYNSLTRNAGSGPGSGKTKLDKERNKMCLREIEHLGSMAKNLKALVTKHSFKERLKTSHTYLQKLKDIIEDPQHGLPDVFIWLINHGKRTAYQRIPARELIFSIVEEECGRYCSKVNTLFLKLPGKKSMGPNGWTIQAKLQMYLWLGLVKHKKYFVNGIPKGYEMSHEIRNAERPRALPPSVIHYSEKYSFQLRAYMYQARSLIGSDASGLSDPFARVLIGEYCKTTQVIDETLSPTWDETLVFEEILVYGIRDEIQADPPVIIIEIFDQDKVGKSEFIGRAMAKPLVKLLEDPYTKPKFPASLEWYPVHRGSEPAGELLATFELFQLPPNNRSGAGELPDLPDPKELYMVSQLGPEQYIGPILPVPEGIRPTLARYRIEVLFWGLRDLKRVHFMSVDKPRVDIECAGHILYSSVIQNAKKNPNFSTPVKFLELELPEQELYRPPLTIRVVDCRSFGRFTLVGTHMINSIHRYMYIPWTRRDKEQQEEKTRAALNGHANIGPPGLPCNGFIDPSEKHKMDIHISATEKSPLLPTSQDTVITMNYFTLQGCGLSRQRSLKSGGKKRRKVSADEIDDEDDDSRDWWSKYFASIEATIEEGKEARREKQLENPSTLSLSTTPGLEDHHTTAGVGVAGHPPGGGHMSGAKKFHSAAKLVSKLSPKGGRPTKNNSKMAKMKIYTSELENQPEFNGFREWLLPFDLYRGKKTGDEEEDDNRVVGTFKGSIKVYKWPLPKDIEDHTIMGFDPQYGFFQGVPNNDPIHVLVRVYVIKGTDLHPMDLNGKADPYVVLQLGSKRISDKENYVSKQLNPVFGKCFEIEATFPQDSMLTIQVLDWDLVGSDDLIGETRIDLENRFYSRHRATCGISSRYEDQGYNRWRDPMKPTQILARLCKDAKMDMPQYSNGKVKIGKKTFHVESCDESGDWVFSKGAEEHMALAVLHNWHTFPRVGCTLVPEHIETRPLYNPDKPGIEQGKLEMWVDLYPMDMPLPGPPIDIAPRKPKAYELRIIIWNTDEVVLEDDAFFTGEKMSDIYVKSWLKGPEDCQCTDIHYRSLTGEGNFNWRFVFPFDYLVAEEKIVISKKESLFSWDESESKIPARLELQVWDADHFSADDFLGAITLDLNRFPRGAKSSKLCTLDMLKQEGNVPMVNIFKQKRVKGWWPFYVKKENEEMELTVSVILV